MNHLTSAKHSNDSAEAVAFNKIFTRGDNMRLMIEALVGMSIGLVVLFSIIYMIFTQKPTIDIQEIPKITQKVKNSKQVIESSSKMLECLDENLTSSNMKCFQEDESNQTIVPIEKSSDFTMVLDKFMESNLFIQSIFGSILMLLVIQLMLFMESFQSVENRNKWLESRKYNISEFSINVPPVLGVVATLFAFGSFAMASSSSGELMTLFRENVFDAVTTTIYGGLVYAINTLLHIQIAQEEE